MRFFPSAATKAAANQAQVPLSIFLRDALADQGAKRDLKSSRVRFPVGYPAGVEWVREQHPNLSEAQARSVLNEALSVWIGLQPYPRHAILDAFHWDPRVAVWLSARAAKDSLAAQPKSAVQTVARGEAGIDRMAEVERDLGFAEAWAAGGKAPNFSQDMDRKGLIDRLDYYSRNYDGDIMVAARTMDYMSRLADMPWYYNLYVSEGKRRGGKKGAATHLMDAVSLLYPPDGNSSRPYYDRIMPAYVDAMQRYPGY